MEEEGKTNEHVNLKEVIEIDKQVEVLEGKLSNAWKELNDTEMTKEFEKLSPTITTALSEMEKLVPSDEHLLQDQVIDMKNRFYLLIRALNLSGLIWLKLDQPEKAKSYLLKSAQLFNNYNGNNDFEFLNYLEDKFPWIVKMTDEYTRTLLYLPKVYHALNDHKIIINFHYIEWANHGGTLSEYFLKIEDFTRARHHLAAASCILETYENILNKESEVNSEPEEVAAKWENFKRSSADIAFHWAKYGVSLLDLSWKRLYHKDEIDEDNNEELQENNDKDNNKDTSVLELAEDLKFDSLGESVELIANQITDKYLLDFSDARAVFLNIRKWLTIAESYYTLNEHASNHVVIAQTVAQAYYYLSFFEEDEGKRAKMHKRRVDVLEHVVKELNPQYYVFTCKQIWIILGEAYKDILMIKLDRLKTAKSTPQAVAKINRLAVTSINYFQKFLDSIDHCQTDSKIQEFPENLLKPALHSYFHIGILYSKIITDDETVQLAITKKCVNALQFVLDYCKKYPESVERVKAPLHLCNELVILKTVRLRTLEAQRVE